MNFRDLQEISYLTQHILTESASEEHNPMNRWPYSSPYLQEDRSGYGGDEKFKQDTDAKSFRPGKDVPKVKKFGRISRAMPASISGHANRTASRVTTIVGDDPGAPRAEKMAKEPKKPKLVKKDGKWVKAEEVDLYDLVLAHLIDEGYADTQESANAIMVNMSSAWMQSIIEG